MEDDQAPPRKRRRPALACEQCRKRKVKCDLEKPCGPCQKSHISPCTFISAGRDNGPIGSSGNGIFTVSKATHTTMPAPADSNGHDVTTGSGGGRAHANDTANESALEALTARMRVLEEKLANTNQSAASAPHVPASSQTQTRDVDDLVSVPGIFNKSRFFGRSHYMYLVFQFEKAFAAILAVDSNEKTGVRSALARCKNIAKSIKAHEIAQAQQSMTMHDLKLQVPARGIADSYVEAYLRTFEPIYRVVHVPSFREQYRQFWANPGDPKLDGFIIKLLLIMSLGAIFFPEDMAASKRLLPTQWIFTAQSWLNSPFEKSRITIETLQIHCLYLISRQANYISGDMVWIPSGTLVHLALHMGLQMDPSSAAAIQLSPLEIESQMKRRLWATILEIVVQSAIDTGGLPTVTQADYDTHAPSNVDDLDFENQSAFWMSRNQVHTVVPRKSFCQSSVQVALARSLPVRLEIGRLLNGVTHTYTYEDVLRLSSELIQSLQESATLFESSIPGSGMSLFHQQIYDLMTRRFLLALHWQFAIKARSNRRYELSHTICVNTSIRLLSFYDDPDFRKLCLQGSGVYRVVYSQAAAFITVECMERVERGPRGPLSDTSSVSEMKALILQHIRDCKERLKISETNPKGSLFFPGLVAQLQALEAGVAPDAAIAAAVSEALIGAETALQTRLDKLSTASSASSQMATPEMFGFDGNLLSWDDSLDFFNDV